MTITFGAFVLYHNANSTTDMGYPSTAPLDGLRMLTLWYERLQGGTCAGIRLDERQRA